MRVNTESVKIREAQPEEAAKLTEIAHDAKRFWGYPESWIKHWQAELTISPELIAGTDVFVAERDEQLLGFYALSPAGDQLELEHLWVRPEHVGTGVGKELFVHAMQRAAQQNFKQVNITADPNAAGFYQKMGAINSGEVVSEVEGQPRVLPRLKIDPKST